MEWSRVKWGRVVVLTAVVALSGSWFAPRLMAQATVQSAYAADAGKLGQKFVALAGAMAGKYDWRPGPGVRSVADVFNLMLRENGMLTRVLTGAGMQPGAGMKSGAGMKPGAMPAPITDPAKMQDALRASYAELQKTIGGLSDSELNAPVKMFGREMPRQEALMLLLSDQHEHLGQSIAYARTNGVVPPWSK